MTKQAQRSEICLERQFSVPVARVFRAWQDPKDLKEWAWGSIGRKVKAEVDFRKGGEFSIATSGSDGQTWSFSGKYLEITPGKRIVHTVAWDAPMGYEPVAETITAEFAETQEGSTLRFIHEGGFGKSARAAHTQGWENVLDTLVSHLED